MPAAIPILPIIPKATIRDPHHIRDGANDNVRGHIVRVVPADEGQEADVCGVEEQAQRCPDAQEGFGPICVFTPVVGGCPHARWVRRESV